MGSLRVAIQNYILEKKGAPLAGLLIFGSLHHDYCLFHPLSFNLHPLPTWLAPPAPNIPFDGTAPLSRRCNPMTVQLSIDLTPSPRLVSCFHPLFLNGVAIQTTAGISVHGFLRDRLGIGDDYLENRIQTLLLNGKAVDDLDTTVVTDGAVLALSAAMPGLAGAILRRAGVLRGLRREISASNQGVSRSAGPIWVTLKLFNFVLKELAPGLLAKGVRIGGNDLDALLTGCCQELERAGIRLIVDGRPAGLAAVTGGRLCGQAIDLEVLTGT